MTSTNLRILHTADWRLASALSELAQIPDSLFDAIADAPTRSVQRVIDFAIAESVDVLVFSGGALDPNHAVASDYAFLHHELTRLHDAKIPVIWNWSRTDRRSQWPRCFQWPANVQQFTGDSPRIINVTCRNGETISFTGLEVSTGDTISPTWFNGVESSHPLFGVGYGVLADSDQELPSIEHWLLGGRPYNASRLETDESVVYAGSPQGRRSDEIGPHGCVLVELTRENALSVQFINTSCVEYLPLTIPAGRASCPVSLEEAVLEILDAKVLDSTIIYAVEVRIIDSNPALQAFVHLSDYAEFLASLQENICLIDGNLLLNRIIPVAIQESESTGSQEILGEYLFIVEELRSHGWSDLALEQLIPQQMAVDWCQLNEDLAGLATLKECESLGIHLLGKAREDAA